jgi:hypothetical protein
MIAAEATDRFLQTVLRQIESGSVANGMVQLILGLRDLRCRLTADAWRSYVERARQHRLLAVLHEDPFAARCFHKPRGYAGDPPLLDYIFDQQIPPHLEITPRGTAIFEFSIRSPAPEAVRNRRRILAQYLDRLAQRMAGATVLSVAAGHLREAESCEALRQRRLGRLVAYDQDDRNLQVVHRDYGAWGVETEQGSIPRLLAAAGKSHLGQFDLVYSAGIYDYFEDRLADRVTRSLFGYVKPGGKLLVANFVPDIRDVGYMECFMDWWLTYRTAETMTALVAGLGAAEVSGQRLFHDETNQIVFLEIAKAVSTKPR